MKSLLVLNWKMHPATWREAKALFEKTKTLAAKAKKLSIVVAPPALYLRDIAALNKGAKVALSIQHAREGVVGARTGEISLAQAKDSKASFVLIGHAERRALGESNADVRAQVNAALEIGLTPILCVGERERTVDGAHFQVVRDELREALMDAPESKLTKVIIAYEPVWAIGSGSAMHSAQMHEMAIFIRKVVVESRGDAGFALHILYGGSIDDHGNAPKMLAEGGVDGLLVGHASVDGEHLEVLMRSLINTA